MVADALTVDVTEGVPVQEALVVAEEDADPVELSEAVAVGVVMADALADVEEVAVCVIGPELVEGELLAVAVPELVSVAVAAPVDVPEADRVAVAELVGLGAAEGVPGTTHVRGTTDTPRSSCAPRVSEYTRVHCTITARSRGLVLINSAVRVTAYSTMLVPSKATLSTLVSAPV